MAFSRMALTVSAVITERRIATTTANHPEPKEGTPAANECDTNADTCCLGENFVILEYTRRTADVYSYDKDSQPKKNIPIVSGATAWRDEKTEEVYILVFNESLYYGTRLDHSLINPNQVRAYGIDFWDNPFDKERGLAINMRESTSIALKTRGTKIILIPGRLLDTN